MTEDNVEHSTRLGLGYRIGLAFVLFVVFLAVILQAVQYVTPAKLTDSGIGYAALAGALCAVGTVVLPRIIALRIPIVNRALEVLSGVVILESMAFVGMLFFCGGDGAKAFATWTSGELIVFRVFESFGVLNCLGYVVTGMPPSAGTYDDGTRFNIDGTPMVHESVFDTNDSPFGTFGSSSFDSRPAFDDYGVNPGTGLPMLNSCIDVGGNVFGCSSSSMFDD